MNNDTSRFSNMIAYTRVPNVLIDKYQPVLTALEFSILILIARKTIGFNKDEDSISYSQFMKFTNTGSRSSISKSIKKLVDLNLITIRKQNNHTSIYKYIGELEFESPQDNSDPKKSQEKLKDGLVQKTNPSVINTTSSLKFRPDTVKISTKTVHTKDMYEIQKETSSLKKYLSDLDDTFFFTKDFYPKAENFLIENDLPWVYCEWLYNHIKKMSAVKSLRDYYYKVFFQETYINLFLDSIKSNSEKIEKTTCPVCGFLSLILEECPNCKHDFSKNEDHIIAKEKAIWNLTPEEKEDYFSQNQIINATYLFKNQPEREKSLAELNKVFNIPIAKRANF